MSSLLVPPSLVVVPAPPTPSMLVLVAVADLRGGAWWSRLLRRQSIRHGVVPVLVHWHPIRVTNPRGDVHRDGRCHAIGAQRESHGLLGHPRGGGPAHHLRHVAGRCPIWQRWCPIWRRRELRWRHLRGRQRPTVPPGLPLPLPPGPFMPPPPASSAALTTCKAVRSSESSSGGRQSPSA